MKRSILTLILVCLVFSGCTKKSDMTPESINNVINTAEEVMPEIEEKRYILDILSEESEISTMGMMMRLTDLDTEEMQNYTLFAPTDSAFGAISAEDRSALLADKEKLRELLEYHIVASSVKDTSGVVMTKSGVEVLLDQSEKGFTVNDASVQKTVMADDGVVYFIDRVLQKPAPVEAEIVQEDTEETGDQPLWKSLNPALVEYNDDQADLLSGVQPFVIFFHAPWDQKSTELFTDIEENIASMPGGTVILWADFDENPDLRERYSVTKQPTAVLIDADGETKKILILPTKSDIASIF